MGWDDVDSMTWGGTEPEGNASILPEGQYECEVLDYTLKTGEEKGTPYVHFDFLITDGKYKNWHIFGNALFLTEKNIDFVARDYRLITGITPSQKVGTDIKDHSFKGDRCIVAVKHEEYNGKKKAAINYFKSINEDAGANEFDADNPDDVPF